MTLIANQFVGGKGLATLIRLLITLFKTKFCARAGSIDKKAVNYQSLKQSKPKSCSKIYFDVRNTI